MEQKIPIKIDYSRARAVFWNGGFLDTNTKIDVDISDALRLGRYYSVETSIPFLRYDQQLWKKDKTFSFTGDADGESGFGNCTVNLIKYSVNKRYDVRWIGKASNIPVLHSLGKKSVPLQSAMVWHEQPSVHWLSSPFEMNIGIVPFETTRIPYSWVSRINSFAALLVPCKQNIQMMRDSGIRIPIELIHWGVDETKWRYMERDNNIFTFGHMGALSTRKGTDILIDAFQAAFPGVKDVKLICKTSYNVYPFMVKDPRIEVQMTAVPFTELVDNFVKKIDCFVFPTRGEGFGLPPLEMMATGVPAIVTNWSGPVDYMTDDIGWKLDYDMEDAVDFTKNIYKEECGQWAKPKLDHLVELMRYAYNNRDEVKTKGKTASEVVLRDWKWSDKIDMFHQALGKHL